MNRRGRPEPFAGGNSFDVLRVPLPVPPMIEQVFGYRGDEQYVSLGFGVRGGVMSDFVGEGALPQTEDLYRSYLLHAAVKPYTDAFRIETDPPECVKHVLVEESDADIEQFESWSETSRCLLLDRKARQFSVGTVAGIGVWLIFKPFLFPNSRMKVRRAKRYGSAREAEAALWAWLELQPAAPLTTDFIHTWNQTFGERQAVSGCIGAGVKLGFEAGEIRRMVAEAFRSPRRGKE